MEDNMSIDYWRSLCNNYIPLFNKISKDNYPNIPRIFIPNEKIELLVGWYRDNYNLINDIIPIFNEYYITIDLKNIIHILKPSILNASQFQTIDDFKLALNIANAFEDFCSCIHIHIVHKTNKVKLTSYSNKNQIIGVFQCHDDNKTPDDFYDTKYICSLFKNIFNDAVTSNKVEYHINMSTYTNIDNIFNKLINALNTLEIVLFSSVNHYIYNYAKTININKDQLIKNLDDTCKRIISKDKKDYKFLTKPLYDIGKLDLVIKNNRKSFVHTPPDHAFIVKGHWRHYKNGKKVFINSYIKCEDRGNLVNNIIVKPRKREVI